MYKKRYSGIKQAAYENACDCMYYGIPSSEWVDCGIEEQERHEVWRLAFWDMAEPDIEHGRMVDNVYHFDPAYE